VRVVDVDELHTSELVERYQRELHMNGLYSGQFPDTFMYRSDVSVVRKRLQDKMFGKLSKRIASSKLNKFLSDMDDEDNPLLFKPNALNWGQYQLSSDSASFAAGVAQRIRRATRDENVQEVKMLEPYGIALYHALCTYFNWDPSTTHALDHYKVEAAIEEFQIRRGDRSEALKRASLSRSDQDYSDFLGAKTQWKMKDLHAPVAKPLQTILTRSDEYLFKLGWVGIYVLDKILEEAPPWVYFHVKKTVEEMQDWVRMWLNFSQHEICDIKGLDMTVRGETVVLMSLIFRRYNIPEDLIDFYCEDKMDFHTRTMHFAIMTFSGELFTWLANSLKTLARECLKFDIMPGRAIAISGDDIEREAGLTISSKFLEWIPFDYCIETREVSQTGSFCSFNIRDGVMFKDPILLYKRLRGQLERGKVDEIALSYFDLFAFNYAQSELLSTVMTEAEHEHFSAIRYIMHNLRKFGYTGSIDWRRIDAARLDWDHHTIRETSEMVESLNSIQITRGDLFDNPIPLDVVSLVYY